MTYLETTEAQIALAREIINENSNYMQGLDRGQCNFSAQEVIQIALAAIQATTASIAQWIDKQELPGVGIEDVDEHIACIGIDLAEAIARGDHLHPHKEGK